MRTNNGPTGAAIRGKHTHAQTRHVQACHRAQRSHARTRWRDPISTAGDAQAAVGGGGCRTTGWAGTTPGVLLQPCSLAGANNNIFGAFYVQNPNGLDVDACAQLLVVNRDGSTSWVHNWDCLGWTKSTNFSWQTDEYAPGNGTYVVQMGYWYNGSYYGNAQSQRITVY